jgi:multiple sugar transport system substrate-binding protein
MIGNRTASALGCVVLLMALSAGNLFAADKSVKLNYWRHEYKPVQALEQQWLDAYQKDHPGVTVETLTVANTDNLHQKLMVAFASNSGPDFFNMSDSEFPQYISAKLVAPVDYSVFGVKNLAELAKKVDPLVAAGLPAFNWDGVQYGVTTEMSQYAMAINTQHFRDAGLDPDKDYPKTWEDLAVVGKKLVKVENGEMTREAFAIPTHSLVFLLVFEGMIRQLGADVVTPDGKGSGLGTPAAAKVLQTFSDYMYKYEISVKSPELNRQNRGFETGASSIVVDVGPWFAGYLETNASEYAKVMAFKPFPRFKGGRNGGAPSYGYGLMVSKDTKYKKEAWDVIRALTADTKARQDVGLYVPATFPWPQEAGTGGFGFFPKSVVDIVWEATSKTLFDKADPKATLAVAKTKVESYLKELKYTVHGYK